MTPERHAEMKETLNQMWVEHLNRDMKTEGYVLYCGMFATYLRECLNELKPGR